jgi:hypothetical protein
VTPRARDASHGLATFVLAIALGTAAVLLRALVSFEYGLDQGIYAVVSDAVLEGGAPYRDAWDFKTPGVFFVYALARGVAGSGMQAVRGLEAVAFASLVAAFAILSRRFVGSVRPGLLGGALAVTGHVWLGFWHTGQPESFGGPLLAWALVLATWEPRPDAARGGRVQWAAWAGAGALYAFAALLKPPLGGGIVVSWAIAARGAWESAPADGRLRATLHPTLAFAAGALAPLAATGLYFSVHGALPDLADALFGFAPEYAAINYRTGNLLIFWFRAIEFLLFRFSLLNVTGLMLFFALPRQGTRERRLAFHVLGVTGFLVAGIALQGRFFAYHYGAALPLVALLAGQGLWKLTRLGRRRALGRLMLVVLANANGVNGPVEGGLAQRLRAWDDGRRYNAPRRRVATWIERHTAPGDAIYVWGFEPVLYDLAARRPASRYVYNAPQRAAWYRERGRAVLMEDLRRTPPEAILVQRGDVHPGTTGNPRDSSAALRTFPALSRLLAEGYAEAATIGDFKIHLREPDRAGAAPPAPGPPRGRGRSAGRPGRGPSP